MILDKPSFHVQKDKRCTFFPSNSLKNLKKTNAIIYFWLLLNYICVHFDAKVFFNLLKTTHTDGLKCWSETPGKFGR